MSQCSQKTSDMQIDEGIVRSESENEENQVEQSIVQEIKKKKKGERIHKNYGFSDSSEANSKPSSGYKRIKSAEKDEEQEAFANKFRFKSKRQKESS